jgi:hypothetical protein
VRRFSSVADLEATIGRKVRVEGNRVSAVGGDGAGAQHQADATSAPARGKGKAREAQDSPRMNKTERRYRDEVLIPEQRAGVIRKFRFEALNLRMGDRTFHRPDFYVVMADGSIQIREVKGGYIRPDALTKWKIAAQDWDEYTWQMWQWKDSRWTKIREQ